MANDAMSKIVMYDAEKVYNEHANDTEKRCCGFCNRFVESNGAYCPLCGHFIRYGAMEADSFVLQSYKQAERPARIMTKTRIFGFAVIALLVIFGVIGACLAGFQDGWSVAIYFAAVIIWGAWTWLAKHKNFRELSTNVTTYKAKITAANVRYQLSKDPNAKSQVTSSYWRLELIVYADIPFKTYVYVHPAQVDDIMHVPEPIIGRIIDVHISDESSIYI